MKILSGQMPRHGHRQKGTIKGSRHKRAIAGRVNALTREGWKEMAAIAKAAEEFDCSRSKVKSVMRAERRFRASLKSELPSFEEASRLMKEMKEKPLTAGQLKELQKIKEQFEDAIAQDYASYGLTYDRSKKDELF